METATDLDLLRLEMDTLWGPDVYGRPLRKHPLVAIAIATEGMAVRWGPTVPNDLREMDTLEIGSPIQAHLDRFRERLGPTRESGGPSYVFGGEEPSSSSHRVVTSESESASMLATLRPEVWGDPQEWADLLVGDFGPWAIGVAENRVTAVCYTPVGSRSAAEAGVWTHPEARGRGWATSVTAAWARAAGPRFDTLFYSTGFENAASQGVARKLRLRPIGTIAHLYGEES